MTQTSLSVLCQVIADNFYGDCGYREPEIVQHISSTGIPDPAHWFAMQRDAGLWQPGIYQGEVVWTVNTALIPDAEYQPEEAPTPCAEPFNHPTFSFFKAPIVRPKGEVILPYQNITLRQLHQVITGNHYRFVTQTARTLYATYKQTGDKKSYSRHKEYKLDYVTFRAVLSHKADSGVVDQSGYLDLDFDKVADVEGLKSALLQDPYFETQLLFTSPRGSGLKWVIAVHRHPTHQEFKGYVAYVQKQYGQQVDRLADISRACFVCQDVQAFIHPKYLN